MMLKGDSDPNFQCEEGGGVLPQIHQFTEHCWVS